MENQNDKELAQKHLAYIAKQKVYQKTYREKHKEKLHIKNQKYHSENKEQILENKKTYYNKNKDEINAKRKEKIICVCGSTTTKDNKSRHIKTKKHISAINEIEKVKKSYTITVEANNGEVISEKLVNLSLDYPNVFN